VTVEAGAGVILQVGKSPRNIKVVCPQAGDDAPGQKQGKHQFVWQEFQKTPEQNRKPVVRLPVAMDIAHAAHLSFC
jgi:hypothetical protein